MTGEAQDPNLAVIGQPVMTACGGLSTYQMDTPWVVYQGNVLYFCLPGCKADFERDPANSCLANGKA